MAEQPRYGLIPQTRELVQSGRVADRRQQDDGCDADQRLAGRRLCRHDLCGLPRRATEVQGQASFVLKAEFATRSICQGLSRGLDDALQATLTDAAKFDRLAARLGASSPDAKDKLRKRIESESRSGARVCAPEPRLPRTRGDPDAWMPSP